LVPAETAGGAHSPGGEHLDLRDILHSIEFSKTMSELHRISRSIRRGPWYRCDIKFSGKQLAFHYQWEGKVTCLGDIPPSDVWSTPTFLFRRRFDLKLISELRADNLEAALVEFFGAAFRTRPELPQALYEYYALFDWQADTCNGALDQYYARSGDCMGAGLPRTRLYPLVDGALGRIGFEPARSLFRESIALYSHFHERVDKARIAMGIPSVEKRTESDIMSRYYEMLADLEKAQATYFLTHLSEFAVAAPLPK
jgi:hypothetical protein